IGAAVGAAWDHESTPGVNPGVASAERWAAEAYQGYLDNAPDYMTDDQKQLYAAHATAQQTMDALSITEGMETLGDDASLWSRAGVGSLNSVAAALTDQDVGAMKEAYTGLTHHYNAL